MICPVFGTLCVECVRYLANGVVPYHFVVCVWMDSGVCVTWMFEEDPSVGSGGWGGHKEKCVGDSHRLNGNERVVSSDEDDAKADTRLWQVSS